MSSSGPLAGARWSLESPEAHAARHDRDQLRYWLAQPPEQRLKQAEAYRIRMFGDGPHHLVRSMRLLPNVVQIRGTVE